MQNSESIEYGAQTDVGLKRKRNEDAITVCSEHGLTILADGMGGYNAGDVASETTIKVIREFLIENLSEVCSPDELPPLVTQAVTLANSTILFMSLNEPGYSGMGTTLVMSLCRDDRLLVAHVGDSRAYRLREGQLIQLTRDHSLVQEQVDAGLLTAEAAQHSAIKNFVTRAVGVPGPVNVEIHIHQIDVGDIYMLCSDGLSDMLTTAKIQETLQNADDSMQARCDELIKLANEEGGRDNISVILFKIKSIKNGGLEQRF